jgi:hypothetical protein
VEQQQQQQQRQQQPADPAKNTSAPTPWPAAAAAATPTAGGRHVRPSLSAVPFAPCICKKTQPHHADKLLLVCNDHQSKWFNHVLLMIHGSFVVHATATLQLQLPLCLLWRETHHNLKCSIMIQPDTGAANKIHESSFGILSQSLTYTQAPIVYTPVVNLAITTSDQCRGSTQTNESATVMSLVLLLLAVSQQARAGDTHAHFLPRSQLAELQDPEYHTVDHIKKTASHNVAWNDEMGRQLFMAYTATKHADVDTLSLDTIKGLLQADVAPGRQLLHLAGGSVVAAVHLQPAVHIWQLSYAPEEQDTIQASPNACADVRITCSLLYCYAAALVWM